MSPIVSYSAQTDEGNERSHNCACILICTICLTINVCFHMHNLSVYVGLLIAFKIIVLVTQHNQSTINYIIHTLKWVYDIKMCVCIGIYIKH